MRLSVVDILLVAVPFVMLGVGAFLYPHPVMIGAAALAVAGQISLVVVAHVRRSRSNAAVAAGVPPSDPRTPELSTNCRWGWVRPAFLLSWLSAVILSRATPAGLHLGFLQLALVLVVGLLLMEIVVYLAGLSRARKRRGLDAGVDEDPPATERLSPWNAPTRSASPNRRWPLAIGVGVGIPALLALLFSFTPVPSPPPQPGIRDTRDAGTDAIRPEAGSTLPIGPDGNAPAHDDRKGRQGPAPPDAGSPDDASPASAALDTPAGPP